MQIAKHLTKLFDSMASLKFEQDGDNNDTKNALGMYSKDGEYVDFPEICDCNGQVNLLALDKHDMLEMFGT